MERDTPHEKVFDALLKCIAAGIMVPKPYLEIGGGEPSLGDGIENIVRYALEHGWEGLINSNGAKFSQVFADGVNAAQFSLLLTPDAGSRETYARIKGADNFDNTWRNIGRYMAATSGKALVKFILEEGNKDDIPAMLATAKKYGVQNLVLSLDLNIPKSRHPEYIAKAKEFLRLAHKKRHVRHPRGLFARVLGRRTLHRCRGRASPGSAPSPFLSLSQRPSGALFSCLTQKP